MPAHRGKDLPHDLVGRLSSLVQLKAGTVFRSGDVEYKYDLRRAKLVSSGPIAHIHTDLKGVIKELGKDKIISRSEVKDGKLIHFQVHHPETGKLLWEKTLEEA